MGTPRPRRAPRRATSADAAAIAALSSAIIPTEANDRAVFVIDGETGPVAAIDLRQMSDHISVEPATGLCRQTESAKRPDVRQEPRRAGPVGIFPRSA